MKKSLAAALMLCATAVSAQGYPSKPVRWIVPFVPGGSIDLVGRVVSQKLSELWGQQIVLDNRGGNGSALGAELVAKAKPDGYTLLMPTSSTMAINPAVYAKMPYDPIKDFAPVTGLVRINQGLLAHPSLPANNIAELIAPQGRFALIDDPASLDIVAFKRKAVSVHWELMFTRSLFDTPDVGEQGRLLDAVAELVDEGRIRTTATDTLSPINAANLIEAHRRIESATTRGKIVLEGWEAQHD